MTHRKSLTVSFFILLSIGIAASIVPADAPTVCKIAGVPRIKQLTNYCGPACLTAVMQHYGMGVTQETVGKAVYNAASGATSGADMLYYARQKGMAAYSWNATAEDLKQKLVAGFPVIALQQNSREDTSGHFRVFTGYDEKVGKFYVMDPYYDNIKELTYKEADQLWKRMGYWALIVMPKDRDIFNKDLNDKNPVVHMDLSYAMFEHKQYAEALKETQLALKLEPKNTYAQSMLNRIRNMIAQNAGQNKSASAEADKAEESPVRQEPDAQQSKATDKQPDEKTGSEQNKPADNEQSANVSAEQDKTASEQQDIKASTKQDGEADIQPNEKASIEQDPAPAAEQSAKS